MKRLCTGRAAAGFRANGLDFPEIDEGNDRFPRCYMAKRNAPAALL
jgi:hypothetical protein